MPTAADYVVHCDLPGNNYHIVYPTDDGNDNILYFR